MALKSDSGHRNWCLSTEERCPSPSEWSETINSWSESHVIWSETNKSWSKIKIGWSETHINWSKTNLQQKKKQSDQVTLLLSRMLIHQFTFLQELRQNLSHLITFCVAIRIKGTVFLACHNACLIDGFYS